MLRKDNTANGLTSSGNSIDPKLESYENHLGSTKLEPEGWQSPEGHYFHRVTVDRNFYANKILRVNGVEVASTAPKLYKGVGQLGETWIDPKTNPDTGKPDPGKFVPYDYPTYRGPREQYGLTPYRPRPIADRHPIISPEATDVETSTTNPKAIHTTWRDLRTELGRGAGARTNKYLLEFSIPIHGSQHPWKYNVLCKATSMPQRSMHTASMWRFGRKYNLRGETNFNDTWTCTFEDDSSHSLRKDFDRWFREIDDTRLQFTALDVYRDMGNPIKRLETQRVDLFEREDTAEFNLGGVLNNVATALIRPEYTTSLPNYQTDVRIYQLDQTGNKVRGYVMQNAFVSDISSIDYGDDKQNELVQFTVTFTFSEFLPLEGNVLDGDVRIFK